MYSNKSLIFNFKTQLFQPMTSSRFVQFRWLCRKRPEAALMLISLLYKVGRIFIKNLTYIMSFWMEIYNDYFHYLTEHIQGHLL